MPKIEPMLLWHHRSLHMGCTALFLCTISSKTYMKGRGARNWAAFTIAATSITTDTLNPYSKVSTCYLGRARKLTTVMVQYSPSRYCNKLISSLNIGPHKVDRFFSEELSKPHITTNRRREIFQRIRAPVQRDVPDNKFVRTEQAFEYYMPRLAGNSGK